MKKRHKSTKMVDKQMEVTSNVAQLDEVVHYELQKENSEADVTPADWFTNPKRQPSWYAHQANTRNGKHVRSEEYLALSENEQFGKIIKLADCMKYMNIEVHPHLLKASYMGTLPAEASALGVKVVEEPELCYGTVGMSRTMPRELVSDNAQTLNLSAVRKNSMRFLHILTAENTAEHLQSRTLTSHMAARKYIHNQGQFTLLVLDSEKYFKKGKRKDNLQMAIVDLLISLKIDTVLIKNADELVTTILQYTKAVAEEPAKFCKRALDEQADFYMRGDNKNCVTVDPQGNGLPRLWQQMLSVLPQSSLDVSRSIAAEFSTPRLLAEAVKSESGVSQLADTDVHRSGAPGARARRLGPEMAHKLQTIFNTTDGNESVD